jgi:hypothetical protein
LAGERRRTEKQKTEKYILRREIAEIWLDVLQHFHITLVCACVRGLRGGLGGGAGAGKRAKESGREGGKERGGESMKEKARV